MGVSTSTEVKGSLSAPQPAAAIDIPTLVATAQAGVERLATASQALFASGEKVSQAIEAAKGVQDRVLLGFGADRGTALQSYITARRDTSGSQDPDKSEPLLQAYLKTGKDVGDLAQLILLGGRAKVALEITGHAAVADQLSPLDASTRAGEYCESSSTKAHKGATAIGAIDVKEMSDDADNVYVFVGAGGDKVAGALARTLSGLGVDGYQARETATDISWRVLAAIADRILNPHAQSYEDSTSSKIAALCQEPEIRSNGGVSNLLVKLGNLVDAARADSGQALSAVGTETITNLALQALENCLPVTGDTSFVRSIISAGPGQTSCFSAALGCLGSYGWATNRAYDLRGEASSAHTAERALCVDVLVKQLIATQDNYRVNDSNHTPLGALTSFGVQGYAPLLGLAEDALRLKGDKQESGEKFLGNILEQVRLMADVKNAGLYLNCRESSREHTDLRDRIEKLCLALAAPDSPMPNLRHEAMWTVAQLGTKSELALKMYRTLLTNKDTVGDVLSYAKDYREWIGLTEQEIKDAEALKESPR